METLVATANAVVGRGAQPVFADIDASTLNIDHDEVERVAPCHSSRSWIASGGNGIGWHAGHDR